MRRIIALAVLVLSSAFAQGQTGGSVPFPRGYDEALAAWTQLPLEQRRALQDALVWTGDYSGIADGEFGRLTFQGLGAFQRRQGATRPSSILDDAQRRALVTAGSRARAAARFETRLDERTGARIGLPLAHVDGQRTDSGSGSRWAARDGRFALQTFRDASRDLEAVYERLRRADGAKIAYHVLRPEFFVVSGVDANDRRFYTRAARRGAEVVGYTATTLAERAAEFDRIVVAIANAFDPVGAGRPAETPVAAAPPAGGARPPAPPPAAAAAANAASAVAVAPGTFATAAAAIEGCRAVTVAGAAARIVSNDPRAGLAVLAVEGSSAPPIPLAAGAPAAGEALVFAGLAGGVLSVAPATAETGPSGALEPSLPMQAGLAGGALLDRRGRLVGVVLGPGRVRTAALGGVFPPVPQRVAGADALATIPGARRAMDEGRAVPVADVVAGARSALAPVACQR